MKYLLSLLAVTVALPAFAQENATQALLKRLPTLPFHEESVGSPGAKDAPKTEGKGAFVGSALLVDAAFTAQYENTPPSAPFMVAVPKSDDVTVIPGSKKNGATELVKIASTTPDKQPIEILHLMDFRVPMQAEPGDRLKACFHLLVTQGLPAVTKGYDDAKYIAAYATKVGTYDAVCVHAHMTKPKTGEHYAVKLVGILHPKQAGGVMAFLMANTKLSEVKQPSDLTSKGMGLQIIHSLRFVEATKTPAKP